MTFDDLPKRLTGTEAATWLATESASLASDASTRRQWLRAHFAAVAHQPVQIFDAAGKLKEKTLLPPREPGTQRQPLEGLRWDPSRADPAKNQHPEPLTEAQKAEIKGTPEQWGNWWVWLRIGGGHVDDAINQLNDALQRGLVMAYVGHNNVAREAWRDHRLAEADPDLLLVYADNPAASKLHGQQITVDRDDLRMLRQPETRQAPDKLSAPTGKLPTYTEAPTYSRDRVPGEFKCWAEKQHSKHTIITASMAEDAMRGSKDKSGHRSGGLLAHGVGLSRNTIREWVNSLPEGWIAAQGKPPLRSSTR